MVLCTDGCVEILGLNKVTPYWFTKEYSTSNTVYAFYLPQVKLNDSLYSEIHTRYHSLTYSSLMHEQEVHC